jgi:cell division protein FtsZ
MSFAYVENENSAKIKVIGVGGAGGNAVNNMINAKLKGVKFIVANTDLQALEHSKAEVKIQIGKQLTEGLGAGADPVKGKDAALESVDEIRESLKDSHMVFITAGFGGGTGTGAAPVVAEVCKELNILTVAVVSKPFSFEGKKRERHADEGLDKLQAIADTVIIIPNDRLRGIAAKGAKMVDMFIKADEILHHSVKGITDLIIMPGHVNLDFADVRTVMLKAGKAMMGIGIASGENRAVEAAERAISHPLLEDISVSGAKAVLMNITSSSDLTMDEMTEASDKIYQEVGEEAEIIWGQAFDDELGDEIRITVIATGIGLDETSPDDSNIHRIEDVVQSINCQQEGQGRQEKAAAQSELGLNRQYTESNGGYVRNPTQEELANWNEYDNPVIVKQEDYRNKSGRFDNEDLEVPTFLRRKAD